MAAVLVTLSGSLWGKIDFGLQMFGLDNSMYCYGQRQREYYSYISFKTLQIEYVQLCDNTASIFFLGYPEQKAIHISWQICLSDLIIILHQCIESHGRFFILVLLLFSMSQLAIVAII